MIAHGVICWPICACSSDVVCEQPKDKPIFVNVINSEADNNNNNNK